MFIVSLCITAYTGQGSSSVSDQVVPDTRITAGSAGNSPPPSRDLNQSAGPSRSLPGPTRDTTPGITKPKPHETCASGKPGHHKRQRTSHSSATHKFTHRDYEIGWVSAIYVEFAAAQALLEDVHETLPSDPHDSNHYVLGRIGRFNVAMACLPAGGMGMNNAAIVSSNMLRTYTAIRVQLLVGVAGGVPTAVNDVRLGDVVVGLSVVQHDFGKTVQDGHFQSTAAVHTPTTRLMSAVNLLRAEYDIRGSRIPDILQQMLQRNPLMDRYADCTGLKDILFDSDYRHVSRSPRSSRHPQVHFGAIASGNQVIKDAQTRDQLGLRHNVLCLEMEGAALKGLDVPFLVIRGICDYADFHKNKDWQPYAAAVAAACATEYLSFLQLGVRSTNYVQPTSRIEALMKSLRFDQMGSRKDTIRRAHNETCTWVLKTRAYQDWLDGSKLEDHHGLLWIKGKPGAGKSTIMKFLLDILEEEKIPSREVISFFFNARGDSMERTVQGMYQSLLLQLLERIPELQEILERVPTTSTDALPKWHTALLQGLLEKALRDTAGYSLFLLIDALDEGDQDEIRSMVYFLEDIRAAAYQEGLRIFVCFASRHYPHITVRKCVELLLDRQPGHEDDIGRYIEDKLNIGSGSIVSAVQAELKHKAAGVFMWVVLVTSILNRHYDHGYGPHALQEELRRVPGDLHAVFRDILLRDKEDRGRMLLCVQWIMFSQRALGPEELYLAIQLGTTESHDLHNNMDKAPFPEEQVKRTILSASKGLVEVTISWNPKVQFIHESVNDFFLRRNGFSLIWPETSGQEASLSHDRLKHTCFRYIQDSAFMLPKKVANKYNASGLSYRAVAGTLIPFLSYSMRNILYHSDQAQAYGVDQRAFLLEFRSLLQNWVAYRNALAGVQYYTDNVSLLYILADYNLHNLIQIYPSILDCLVVERERYGYPLFSALAAQSFDAIKVFASAMRPEISEDGRIAGSEEIADGRVSRLFVDGFSYTTNRHILSYLAEYGDQYLFCCVLQSGLIDIDVEASDRDGRTLLSWTAWWGLVDAVRLLLDRGAAVDAKDHMSRTPLHWAAEKGRANVITLLVQHGAEGDAADVTEATPLIKAATEGHSEATRRLQEHGVSNEAVDMFGRSALSRASENVVRELLQGGASTCTEDPSMNWTPLRDYDGRTPLSWAAQVGVASCVRLLLATGSMVDSQDEQGRTPLTYATEWHNKETAVILLEHGAALDIGWTAWQGQCSAWMIKECPGLALCLSRKFLPA
ncbi:uncharacterized protein B0I36DRAFT_378122 [Microdochium trichocladiopsis]|uniref:NACHT domain-containing protein n=1 Tax=Microdochium trichocladiopsis TaxID=1682393 RepID=A0A9P8XRY0_9PEZI|nr:uncharacterized protein B0I36DRAFT_378122 [Microdochium trichocladiopsis]KAH7014390.1 hypothetical protein B0I36DRAFT_378122 [Microdochium trichocladiopsis]